MARWTVIGSSRNADRTSMKVLIADDSEVVRRLVAARLSPTATR